MNFVYLMFCNTCGSPKQLSPFILKHYIHPETVEFVYCTNCKSENTIPWFLKKIASDLTKEDGLV